MPARNTVGVIKIVGRQLFLWLLNPLRVTNVSQNGYSNDPNTDQNVVLVSRNPGLGAGSSLIQAREHLSSCTVLFLNFYLLLFSLGFMSSLLIGGHYALFWSGKNNLFLQIEAHIYSLFLGTAKAPALLGCSALTPRFS